MIAVEADRVRVDHEYQNGLGISLYAIRFGSTGTLLHEFADHRHAVNFTRYLFSLTKAHPRNDLTSRNVVCVTRDGRVDFRPLDNPYGQHKDFIREFFPKSGAEKMLSDDGFYVCFSVSLPDGSAWSNLVSRTDKGLVFEPDLLASHRGSQEDADLLLERLSDKEDAMIHSFEDESPSQTAAFVDRVVQSVLSSVIGGRSLMSVSHRDQTDHNQCYHVHRLLVEPPEDAGWPYPNE